jgi:hypothetical protein
MEGVPKLISPKQHKMLDWIVTGTFMTVGGLFMAFGGRKGKRAGIAAMINGGMVLGATLLTDYDGDGRKPLSFYTHRKLDIGQLSLAASAPQMFGFSDQAKSWFFRAQALSEVMVIAMTDWDAGARPTERIRDLAA